jgi:hypothetical protein
MDTKACLHFCGHGAEKVHLQQQSEALTSHWPSPMAPIFLVHYMGLFLMAMVYRNYHQ